MAAASLMVHITEDHNEVLMFYVIILSSKTSELSR